LGGLAPVRKTSCRFTPEAFPLKRKGGSIFRTDIEAWSISLSKRYMARGEAVKSDDSWKNGYHDYQALPSRFTNRMDSGNFTEQESNFFVPVLWKRRRDGGDTPVSVLTVVTMTSMIATLGLESVTNHPCTGDREWRRGGHAQGVVK
jgi:hypothetical protein